MAIIVFLGIFKLMTNAQPRLKHLFELILLVSARRLRRRAETNKIASAESGK